MLSPTMAQVGLALAVVAKMGEIAKLRRANERRATPGTLNANGNRCGVITPRQV
jgi:hypothetical protein